MAKERPESLTEVLDRAIEWSNAQSMLPDTLCPIHPDVHAEACRLLGLPKNSPLTRVQIMEAASIAMTHLFVTREEI